MTVFAMRSGVFTTLSVSYGWMFLADASPAYQEHCQLRAGNGYLAVTYRRPDKLAFLQAFGEQAQTISISLKNFDGVTPSATEDKQVTGEDYHSSTCCTLFSQSVEGFTHIGNASNEPDTGT